MTSGKEATLKKLIEEYMVMTEAIANTGKKARSFNTDVTIYRSEIHLIQLVGDYERLHISDIARKFGITKGAVSQMVKKLEKKDLVIKQRDATNQTRMLIALTAKGERAYHAHEAYHQAHDRAMFSFLEELSARELAVIRDFLKHVVDMTDTAS